MALSQKGAGYVNRAHITDPYLKAALDDFASQIQNVANQTNALPQGSRPTPANISSLSVTAADGLFDLLITDLSPVDRGIQYFAEYSASVGGPWTTVPMGPSPNLRKFLGNLTLFWRAYSQYQTSPPSSPVYFGTPATPTPVTGGGVAGPTPHPSGGSGTAQGNRQPGGAGFGDKPFRDRNFVDR